MNDQNTQPLTDSPRISVKRMYIEVALGLILFILGFLIMGYKGNYMNPKGVRGIGAAFMGLSFITSPNAWVLAMNYSRPKSLSFIRFGPLYCRIVGAIIIIFGILQIFIK